MIGCRIMNMAQDGANVKAPNGVPAHVSPWGGMLSLSGATVDMATGQEFAPLVGGTVTALEFEGGAAMVRVLCPDREVRSFLVDGNTFRPL